MSDGQTVKPETIIDGGGLWNGRLLLFRRLDSTNRWARMHLDSLMHGDAVEADRQTAGRGRQSRSWLASDDRGLAVSFVFKDLDAVESNSMLGQAAALAVRDLLKTLGVHALLKWPNDVMVDRKKICGILLEADTEKKAIVVGIGVNVNLTEEDFHHHDLNGKATSIRLSSGVEQEKNDIRQRLTRALVGWLDVFFKEGASVVVDAWNASDWLAGSTIEVSTPAENVRGRYAGLDSRGRLVLLDSAGVERSFWSGDVTKVDPVSGARIPS